MTQLFERTALAFDHGEFTLARQAYRRLFHLAEREDNYSYCISLFDLTDLDQKEAIACYLRAIYQTEPLAQRPRVLYQEMRRFAGLDGQLYGDAPRLKDLIQISPDPLPEQEAFPRKWSSLLRNQNDLLADTWLCEVVRPVEGTAGLERIREQFRRYRAFHRKLQSALARKRQNLVGQLFSGRRHSFAHPSNAFAHL